MSVGKSRLCFVNTIDNHQANFQKFHWFQRFSACKVRDDVGKGKREVERSARGVDQCSEKAVVAD